MRQNRYGKESIYGQKETVREQFESGLTKRND